MPALTSPVVAKDPTALRTFFSDERWKGFQHNPTLSAWEEWDRLVKHMDWPLRTWQKRGTPKTNTPQTPEVLQRAAAYADFKRALVQQFSQLYGSDASSLDSWRKLCTAIGITPIPGTVDDAKKAVSSVHICVADLVVSYRAGEQAPIKKFRNAEALRKHLRQRGRGRTFPKHAAYANGLLRYLLREVWSGYRGNRKQKGQNSS